MSSEKYEKSSREQISWQCPEKMDNSSMEKIIEKLKTKYGCKSYYELAKKIGITERQIYNVKKGKGSYILKQYLKLLCRGA